MKSSRELTLPAIFVLVACFLMTAVGNGLGAQTNTLYLNPITQEIGVPRSLFSSLYSGVALAIIPVMSNIARIKRALGSYRALVAVAFAMNVAGFLIAGLSHQFWPFSIYIFTIQLSSQMVSTTPIAGLVNNWFTKNRGLLLGLVATGSSVGGAVWSFLSGRWIEAYGWRTSLFISTGIMLVFGVAVFFMAREYPKGKGPAAPVLAEEAQRGAPVVRPSIWRDRNVLFLGGATFFLICALHGVRLNSAVILQDAGLDTVGSATMLSYMLLVSAIAKIVIGILNDRFGPMVTRTIMIGLAALGILSLIFAGHRLAQWSFSLFFGCGFACMMMLLPIHAARYFPPDRLDEVYGAVSVFHAGGVFIGIPMVNLWYENVGNYTGILIIYTAFLFFAWLLYSRIRPSGSKEALAAGPA